MSQADLFQQDPPAPEVEQGGYDPDSPLSADVFTLLRLFENHRGIDRPQDWFDLKQRYHGAMDDPASREVWSAPRLSKALDHAEADGLVVYRDKWEITQAGIEARKNETVRRMRSASGLPTRNRGT